MVVERKLWVRDFWPTRQIHKRAFNTASSRFAACKALGVLTSCDGKTAGTASSGRCRAARARRWVQRLWRPLFFQASCMQWCAVFRYTSKYLRQEVLPRRSRSFSPETFLLKAFGTGGCQGQRLTTLLQRCLAHCTRSLSSKGCNTGPSIVVPMNLRSLNNCSPFWEHEFRPTATS